MLFSSITFLVYFLPLVIGLLFCLPKEFRPFFLLVSSLVFYGWSDPPFILLLLLEIFCGWIFGLGIQKSNGKGRKLMLAAGIAIPAALLFWFKYYNFFAENLDRLAPGLLPLRSVVLPLGISFYTFQIISYLIDVYRGQVPVQKSLIILGMYVSMFPQLIAGPIVRYDQLYTQLKTWKIHPTDMQPGAGRFVCGLAKKVLIADQLAAFSLAYRQMAEPTAGMAWLNAAAVLLYIYYDFSGYSDMAIGLGRLLGFRFPENFNYPLTAGTLSEFWRRWHMTLTGWFRDYIYIPLGGSRKSTGRTVFNLLVVWLFTGLWHGAAWNFVLWGLLFFVLLCLEKFILPQNVLRSPFYRIWTVLMLLLSFLLFHDDSLGQFAFDIRSMFGMEGLNLWSFESSYLAVSNLVVFCIAAAGIFPWCHQTYTRFSETAFGEYAAPAAMAVILLLCIAWIDAGSFSPFLYFRF